MEETRLEMVPFRPFDRLRHRSYRGRPAWAAAPCRRDRQADLAARAAVPRAVSQDSARRDLRGRVHLAVHGSRLGGAPGAHPLWRAAGVRLSAPRARERDVLAGPRGQIFAGGEHARLCCPADGKPLCRAAGGKHDRRPRYRAAGRRGRHPGRRRDCGGEHVRRRHRAASVSRARRRAAGLFLQGRQHDGLDARLCGASV